MVTVTFTGDVAFSHYFEEIDESRLVDDNVEHFLSSSDYCVANIEGAIIKTKDNKAERFVHSSDPKYCDLLKKLNIRVWNVGNNHILDYGSDGIIMTLEHAEATASSCIGAGKTETNANNPFIIEKGGGIGIISISNDNRKGEGGYCTFFYKNFDVIKEAIKNIKRNLRWCVVVVHAGDEFADMPMPETRKIYKKYLDFGADIVIGHHPHVVQNYEIFDSKIIFYSLGNFIFDTDYQRIQMHTDIGVLLKICFSDEKYSWECLATKLLRKENRVVVTELPIIFDEISCEQYHRLWKYAARQLVFANRKIAKYVLPERFKGYNAFLWNLRELYHCCKNKKSREWEIGKITSHFTRLNDMDKPFKNYMGYN